ncbi:MAG TPA: ATP-binding protein [Albitalea sp.]|jgi:signal transduction histidine kinase/ActR/RegA family two-component response regulator|nr:ATP-binding protein [Albitalea sp.]
MSEAGGTSLRRKLMLVVLATTCVALLLAATALLIYELRSYQKTWLDDLNTQARIIASASSPALTFDDPKVTAENLALLELRPQIIAGAVYRPDGQLFASYVRPGAAAAVLPARAGPPGVVIDNDRVELFQPIVENRQLIGTVYLRSGFDILGRLVDYLLILAAVMMTSLLIAALVTTRLQDSLMAPILGVAQVARNVLTRRDFSLRAEKTSADEVGTLVDAFNNMLEEVGKRTEALEQSNNHLSVEMAERRKAEEALRAAARTKDQFLATLAHELRNPLAPITNAVEILRRAGLTDPLHKRPLEIMSRQVQQMVRLIDDLLDVSRITTGKVLLEMNRVDLVAVLNSAVEIALPGIESRHHQLSLDLPEGPVFVQGDATRLAQVFANLLNNASKYTDAGGRIAVRLEQTPDEFVVHVTDSGMGIAQDKQDSIFDMFVQVDQSLERGSRSGLGVGLTLARQLIELHGGRISVHSAGLGAGSEFIVRLQRGALSPPAPPPPPPISAPIPRHKVLVADDNVDFANSLSSILDSLGQSVTVVHDGSAALEAASRLRPEFIFLDIGMPGLNGYEVAQRLRRQPSTCDAVIVAITGWGQDKDRERAREAGFDQHLVKPADVEHLVRLLRAGSAATAAN